MSLKNLGWLLFFVCLAVISGLFTWQLNKSQHLEVGEYSTELHYGRFIVLPRPDQDVPPPDLAVYMTGQCQIGATEFTINAQMYTLGVGMEREVEMYLYEDEGNIIPPELAAVESRTASLTVSLDAITLQLADVFSCELEYR